MDKKETTGTYQDRIHLLEAFQKAIMRWFNRNHEPEGRDELKSYINRNLMAVRSMVEDAGTLRLMALTPPPAIGGLMARVDPFHMIFQDWYGRSLIPNIADMVDQAIGVYQHLDENSGLYPTSITAGLGYRSCD